ncbi:potassium channel family protein [Haloferula sp.]|uniref:potassium channel family protein n=1 Tax=Haloferula sp. TaxID=2497595 RepID=UPI003C737248
MNPLLLACGIALLAVTLIDALWTTVMPHGAGPLSGRVCRVMWALVKRCPSPLRRRLLPVVGSLSMLVVIFGGVLMLWLGWMVLFCADPSSIVNTKTGMDAGHIDRAYFTGFTLFTLGNGDFVPNGPFWQLVTVVSSFSGLFLVTLSITYLLPVLSAATQKRQLAAMIRDLGADPQSVVIEAWDGKGFDMLMRKTSSTLSPMIHLHAQRHLEYPVLHYFQSIKVEASLAIGIAVLDEALALIAHAAAPNTRPHPSEILHARRSINGLLDMLGTTYVQRAGENPSPPEVARLANAGIPMADAKELEEAVSDSSQRRRHLRAFVEDAGWTWSDLTPLGSFTPTVGQVKQNDP